VRHHDKLSAQIRSSAYSVGTWSRVALVYRKGDAPLSDALISGRGGLAFLMLAYLRACN
jgi:hypothetical protein